MAATGRIQKVAEAAGVDHKTVRRAFELNGEDIHALETEDAAELVRAYVDQARHVGHGAGGRGLGASSPLSEVQVRLTEARARKLEIETAEAEGRLVSREAVTETGVRVIAAARTALLSLGNRLAEKLAGKTDLKEIAHIVETEVRDLLGVLADDAKFFEALEAEALS